MTLPPALRQYTSALLDLVYPRRCEICEDLLEAGRPDASRWLCDTCLQGLVRLKSPFCMVCGEPYEGAMTDTFRCGNCADLKLHFDFAVAAYHAEGTARELVHRFKYQKRLDLCGLLACLLGHTLTDERLAASGDWILTAVPLHHARQRDRQFNQAWELCRQLSKLTGQPARQILKRVRSTRQQAALSRNQRIENLRGAFALPRSLAGKETLRGRNILLVDDVLTTGSTTSECARVLKRDGGAEKVVVITIARG